MGFSRMFLSSLNSRLAEHSPNMLVGETFRDENGLALFAIRE
jgi:hypothetical protein